MNSRRLIKMSFPLLALIAIYFLGSKPKQPIYNQQLPTIPSEAAALEEFIQANDAKHIIKPDNEARIVWNDSTRQKTEYAVVYLHGFSASQKEGDPTHIRFAKRFGANLYLPRLSDHGVDTTETLLHFTADRFWESAKEALAIGKQLGNKVILLTTSTGGTAALKLAADFPDDVFALINMSPNIAINDPAAFLLNDPWGLNIARLVMGGDYYITGADSAAMKYWNKKYRLESLVELQQLLETTMIEETFSQVKQPCLTLYYFKSEQEQDPQVKVSAMLRMHEQLGTPAELKEAIAVPTAGAHVMGGAMASKDIESVYVAIEKFAIEKLKMKPVN